MFVIYAFPVLRNRLEIIDTRVIDAYDYRIFSSIERLFYIKMLYHINASDKF